MHLAIDPFIRIFNNLIQGSTFTTAAIATNNDITILISSQKSHHLCSVEHQQHKNIPN